MVNKCRSLIVCCILLLFSSCDVNSVKIRGNVKGSKGEVEFYTLDSETGDTILKGRQQVADDSTINFRVKGMHLPGKVCLKKGDKTSPFFLIDDKRTTFISGDWQADTFWYITGSDLENEYRAVKMLLKQQYDDPLTELAYSAKKMMANGSYRGDEEPLRKIRLLQSRYLFYRNEYVKAMIETNPAHELSLVLILDELRDSANLQRRMFESLTVENRKSDLYNLLDKRLK